MKKIVRFLIPLLLLATILVSIVWYLFSYDRNFTRDTLLSQARYHDLHGNSQFSAWCYNLAYSFSGQDQNVAIELANQYKNSGNYTKAEYTLTRAIHSHPTAELYTALCKTFVEQDKLLDAYNLLNNIQDEGILSQINQNRPSAPSTDYPAGFYNQHMTIHLSSNGVIFYTAEEDFPSVATDSYPGSIALPVGESTIRAIAVSENGLVSPATILSYTITGVVEEVSFHDATLEQAIRDSIGASANSKIFSNQLWEIQEFEVPAGVKDYSDLSQLSHLKTLTLQGEKLSDLDFLSPLNSLTKLDLSGSNFPADALTTVAGLPNLAELNISNCSLSSISGLAAAPALTFLDMSNNTVRNLEALAPMTTLKEISLQHNAVTDLQALGSLPNLQKLDVSYNVITELRPLVGSSKLYSLQADHNKITSLAGVEQLPLLTELSVNYNSLQDIPELESCTGLVELSIANNGLTDISQLSGLTKLEIFDFSSNQIPDLPQWPDGCPLKTIDGSYNAITSIDSLQNMDDLAYIYMDYNVLTDIDALADNFCLVQVNVFGNKISDVSKLRERDIIVNYDPT